jgi:hypothetical protein
VDRSQPAGVKAVQALLACLAVPHQPDLPEHPQVFGRPGWVIPSSWANSVTGRSPARSSTRISRRCGSAIALKTSDVVAARAMAAIICHIGMRQAERNQRVLSDDDWPRPRSATPSRSGARQGRFCTRTATASSVPKRFHRLLDNNDLVGSMGRAGAACEDAATESFFSLLQKACSTPDAGRPARNSASRSSPGSKPSTTGDDANGPRQAHPGRV